MTPTGLIIWMIAMAIMTIVVLTVGTLAAAGIVGDSSDAEPRRPGEGEADSAAQPEPARPAVEERNEELAGRLRG